MPYFDDVIVEAVFSDLSLECVDEYLPVPSAYLSSRPMVPVSPFLAERHPECEFKASAYVVRGHDSVPDEFPLVIDPV